MPRSIGGLNAAGEWQELRAMLPDLQGKRVLDLGCGFGWHCRYAREQDASSVIGVDLSENMLEKAKEMTDDPEITYIRLAIEDIEFQAEQFDVVISSLALHYVERFDLLCQKVYTYLAPGGTFVLSVEHPVFTSLASQDWIYGTDGERLHWPVDDYHHEGLRETRFLGNDVIKYHRNVATHMNALIDAGFTITKVSEPGPSKEMLEKVPGMQDELRRPIFLMFSAVKK
nr:class I SAM-dependent methyltransferase [Paenibacillus sp. GSMTC-2017]